MDNKKIYTIQINGIKESVNAVDSLNKQLDELEGRIKSLESRTVKVGTVGGSGGTSKTLSQQTSAEKEINKLKEEGIKLDAKIAAAQTEVYQNVLATKDVYKEVLADQKSIAAQERLTANAYSNTMQGMKQKLSDLKSVINTTDLGDSDSIKKMTQEANELTNKLKEMEEAYGQFGRNVGNYQDAANGFKKLNIEVNGVTRSFDNAKQAMATLKKERDTLGLTAGKTSKEFKELDEIVKTLQSDIKDMSKSSQAMDNLLDTMEGFAAIGTISTGFASLFGFDDAEIEKSIQKMVAFQNVLKGIETINKQIQTKEGIGKWIAPFNKGIDTATSKLLVFNRALLGTGTAAKVASAGIKLFSKAIKAAFSVGIMIVIEALITKLTDLVSSFNKVDEATERAKEVQESAAQAYAEATVKMSRYRNEVDNFNGSKKEEKRLVEELNKNLGNSIGQYKTLSSWKARLKEVTDAYIQSMMLEAKQQAILNQLTQAYEKKYNAVKNMKAPFTFWEQVQEFTLGSRYVYGKRREKVSEADKEIKDVEKKAEANAKILDEYNKKYKLGDYSTQIEKGTKNTKKAVENGQKEITQLELRLMQDGLNKRLRQLDIERDEIIKKIKENGKDVSENIIKVQALYAKLKENEIKDYLKGIDKSIAETASDIKNTQFDIDIDGLENKLESLRNILDKLGEKDVIPSELVSQLDISKMLDTKKPFEGDRFAFATFVDKLTKLKESNVEEFNKGIDLFIKDIEYNDTEANKIINELLRKNTTFFDELSPDVKKELKRQAALDYLKTEYANELDLYKNFNADMSQTLSESLKKRYENTEHYGRMTVGNMINTAKEIAEVQKEINKKEQEQAGDAELKRYQNKQTPLQKEKDEIENTLKTMSVTTDKEVELQYQLMERLATINSQIEENLVQHGEKMANIAETAANKEKEIEKNKEQTISSLRNDYYSKQISNFSESLAKVGTDISDSNITIKGLKEQKKAIEETIREISAEKEKLGNDGLISEKDKNETLKNLNAMQRGATATLNTIDTTIENKKEKLRATIREWVNVFGQMVNEVLTTVFNNQDFYFNKEMDALDKSIDAAKKKYEEMDALADEHKNNMESIEDQIASAQGDAREHLLQSYNAEIEAQREALREKKKAEKEEEKLNAKKEKMEEKQRKREHNRAVAQALINTALSVTYAAINHWPEPATTMVAMAAALGATQVAAIMAQKYAEGGVLQGKSHAQGGIKVLGGQAEVEGGEYITNKVTTAKNVDLLEYINTKKRRVNLDDLIEFYGGNSSVKKNIQGVRTKFADGGQIPMLSNNIELNNGLAQAMQEYANRPTVVSVVDILNGTERVNNVKVLAGLA